MSKNLYAELKEKQAKEVHALPIRFAFGDEQFKKMMREFGLHEDEVDKIYSLGNTGGFYKQTDQELIISTSERHQQEHQAAIAADNTGNGYIYQMFYYELANHEYCIGYDLTDTLEALGLTYEEIEKDMRLLHGFTKAKSDYLKHYR